ncbi:Hypothetical protein FKW44_014142 [Caligus rogercresseyi]|uniref:Uncharacterized protein n=1 Tax=Caligus rogercresseyi TaxID=217165 RepID=A0A7T8GZ63_CALRO|nr:Hypothetical protein FKW44_014142 [Caligus rogercresseyi]
MKITLLAAVETRFAGIEEEPLYSIATLVYLRYKDSGGNYCTFFFRYITQSDNLITAKDKLIWEVAKVEKRAATAGEGTEAAVAGPMSKKNDQQQAAVWASSRTRS